MAQTIQTQFNLNSITDIKNFIAQSTKCTGEVTVKSGRHTVDGKSILGLFSLDLSTPVLVEVNQSDMLILTSYCKIAE